MLEFEALLRSYADRVEGYLHSCFTDAAEPIADILASATTLTLFLSQRKKLLPTEKDAPKG